jgi:integrase
MSIKVREKELADGRISLYLDIYYAGRRSYEFLGIHLTKDRQQNKELKELAESIRAKRQLEMQSNSYGVSPHFKKKVNFLEYFRQTYKARVEKEGLKVEKNYKTAYAHLDAFTKGQGIQIGCIDERWLEDFKTYLSSKMGNGTANIYLGEVKTILRIAHKEGYIGQNPATHFKLFKVSESEKAFLTAPEVQKLAETPCQNPGIKLAFLFGCFTGLRHSDIRAITWGDIKDGKIHFRQRKTQGFEYLPLNDTALAIIEKCKGKNELPLPDNRVFKLPHFSHINEILKPWITKAGIKKRITFHCSRHTFATSLLTAGTDLYTVSKLLGHKSIASTAIYAKIIDEKKLSAVNSLPQVEVVG